MGHEDPGTEIIPHTPELTLGPSWVTAPLRLLVLMHPGFSCTPDSEKELVLGQVFAGELAGPSCMVWGVKFTPLPT